MRAIVLEKFGGPDSLIYTDLPEPEPMPGHVVIEIKALGQLQPVPANGQRRLPDLLRQFRIRHSAVPPVRCAAPEDCRTGGRRASQGEAKPGVPLRGDP